MKNKNSFPDRLAMLRCLLGMVQAVAGSRHVHIQFPAGRPLLVLIYVAIADEERRPAATVGELSRALKVSQAATSRAVAGHIASGALDAAVSKDERMTAVRLSRAGRAFIDEVLTAMSRQ